MRPLIDLREQVVSFPPQPVITSDNLVVGIDSVIYFQVTDPRAADLRDRQLHPGRRTAHHHHAAQRRRRAEPGAGADQPRRDQQPAARRARRGHRPVGHPGRPRRDQGDRPAAVHPGRDGEADARRPGQAGGDPHAEGAAAVGDQDRRGQQAGRSSRRGPAQAAILQAEGQSRAIEKVFKRPPQRPDPKLLAYQYLQTLPQLAQSPGNTFWVIPSEVTSALQGVSKAFTWRRFPGRRQRARRRRSSSAADEGTEQGLGGGGGGRGRRPGSREPQRAAPAHAGGWRTPSVAFTDLEKEHQER